MQLVLGDGPLARGLVELEQDGGVLGLLLRIVRRKRERAVAGRGDEEGPGLERKGPCAVAAGGGLRGHCDFGFCCGLGAVREVQSDEQAQVFAEGGGS